MKKIVVVILVLLSLFNLSFAGDGTISATRTIDLHPYGGKGVLYIQGDNAYIIWDNGNVYHCADGVAQVWIEIMQQP